MAATWEQHPSTWIQYSNVACSNSVNYPILSKDLWLLFTCTFYIYIHSYSYTYDYTEVNVNGTVYTYTYTRLNLHVHQACSIGMRW